MSSGGGPLGLVIRFLTVALLICLAARLLVWLVWPLWPWLVGLLAAVIALQAALGARRL